MPRRLSVTLSVLALALLALSACGGSQATAPEPVNTPLSETSAAAESEGATESTDEVRTPSVVAEESEASSEAVDTPTPELSAASDSGETTESIVDTPDSELSAASESEEATESTGEVRTFTIVPEESKASYIVEEEFFAGALDRLNISPGIVDTIGSTQEIEGELSLDPEGPSPLLSNHFTVDLRSLTSDQPRRDQAIRSRNLESNTYPLAEFTATALEDTPENYAEGEELSFKAVGELTIREITNPVTFDVTAALRGDTIKGVASATLRMTDFGFSPPNFANVFSVEDEFTIKVEFTLKEE